MTTMDLTLEAAEAETARLQAQQRTWTERRAHLAADLDALHAQALELVLRRAGLRALTLPVDLDPLRIGRALVALTPSAVVLVGRNASLDTFGRLVYAARRSTDGVRIYDFRGALPETGARTVPRLGERPMAAREKLLADLDEHTRAGAARPRDSAVS